MMGLAMSRAAAALFRALLARAEVPHDRILLTEWRSVDWQSLTFVGERHEIELRVTGSDSGHVAAELVKGIGDAEFVLPGHFVAEIVLVRGPNPLSDGSVVVCLEALTIAD